MARILLVEDDVSIQNVVAFVLRAEGHEVVVEPDGQRALTLATGSEAFQLVILDVMLPGMNGLDVAMALRSQADTPIMMLTALDDDGDIMKGLAMGADEYITKPFSPVVLAAKVRANLRRSQRPPGPAEADAEADAEVLRVGPLMVDGRQWRVELAGQELILTAREFKLLTFLMRHPGQVMSRDTIIERVWSADFDGSDRVVDVCLSRLRRQLFDLEACPVAVRAIPGAGYKLVPKSS